MTSWYKLKLGNNIAFVRFWDRQCALCTMCNVHCANSGTKAGKWILSKQNIKERKIFPSNVDCQVWKIRIMSYSQESCQISQFSMCNSISKKFPFFVFFWWAKLDREVLVTNLTSWLGKVEKLDKLLSIANNFFHQLLIVTNCCHQLSTIVVTYCQQLLSPIFDCQQFQELKLEKLSGISIPSL